MHSGQRERQKVFYSFLFFLLAKFVFIQKKALLRKVIYTKNFGVFDIDYDQIQTFSRIIKKIPQKM